MVEVCGQEGVVGLVEEAVGWVVDLVEAYIQEQVVGWVEEAVE